MDYEKKYKDALERAKTIYQGSYKPDVAATIAETLQNIFPELAESEDEKIRKGILELVRQSSEILDKQNQNNMIAWLEKQAEQKVSYTTLVETGNGRINALVTKELPTNSSDDEQEPTDEEMKELLRTEYEKGRADTIAEMQKPAWSEEDNKWIENLIQTFKDGYLEGFNQLKSYGVISWLKSLKERL